MGKYRKFTPEYRWEAVRLVIETSRPIAEVARELGVNEGTLGNWVNIYRREHPVAEQPSLSTWAEALAPLTISDPRAGMETSPI